MPLSEPVRIRTLGILGAGRAGTALARVALNSGLAVKMASTRSPVAMHYHLAQYAPGASAVEAENIADGVDAVVLMVPQEDLVDVDREWLGDGVLIDATNRWEDEPLPNWLEANLSAGLSSSESIAAHFSATTVVKAFNHLSHWDLDSAERKTTTVPRGLAVASNDAVAAQSVADLIVELGYDPALLPNLADGRGMEPGSAVFNQPMDAQKLRSILA